jgi:siroheme synthase-like protein
MLGYPLFLKLEGRQCLVFGGGRVAARKIRALLKRGARVTCVSQDFSKALRDWAKRNRSRLVLKRVGKGSTRQPLGRGNRAPALVVAATSDRNFNARVAQACRRKKIWVNAVDDPEFCDFYAPAILERGPLQIAISTGGTSPLFAKRLREELERVIPSSTGRLLEKLGRLRRKVLLKKKQL